MMFPHLYKHNKRKNRTVAEVLHNDRWISDVMQDFTVPLLDAYVQLWGLVEDAGFQPEDLEPDTLVWTRTPSGEYSARSAYKIQFEGGGIFSSFPKTVWKVWTPSRCNFFLWLLLQNRVWAVDRLLLKEWPNSYFCQLCHRNLETAQHLFIKCPVTHSIWAPISNWCGRQSLNPDYLGLGFSSYGLVRGVGWKCYRHAYQRNAIVGNTSGLDDLVREEQHNFQCSR